MEQMGLIYRRPQVDSGKQRPLSVMANQRYYDSNTISYKNGLGLSLRNCYSWAVYPSFGDISLNLKYSLCFESMLSLVFIHVRQETVLWLFPNSLLELM